MGELSLSCIWKNRETEALRMRNRYLRRSTSKIRLIEEVNRHHVAQKTVEIEDVKEQLTVFVPGFVGEHQIDVVIQVCRIIC